MSVFVRKPKAITMIPKTAATRTIAKLVTIVIHTLLEVTWSAGDMPMPDCLRASCCLWGPKLDKAETASSALSSTGRFATSFAPGIGATELFTLRSFPSLPLCCSVTWLPPSSREALRLCAPASRRVCLYRSAPWKGCTYVTVINDRQKWGCQGWVRNCCKDVPPLELRPLLC